MPLAISKQQQGGVYFAFYTVHCFQAQILSYFYTTFWNVILKILHEYAYAFFCTQKSGYISVSYALFANNVPNVGLFVLFFPPNRHILNTC